MEKNLNNKCFICFKGAQDRGGVGSGHTAPQLRVHLFAGEKGPAPSGALPLVELPCRKNPL